MAQDFSHSVNEVKLGYDSIKSVGGENSLPFLNLSGKYNSPKIALEIYDFMPKNYPDLLKEYYSKYFENLGSWVKAAAEVRADLVCLRLIGCHPDEKDSDEAGAVNSVKMVLDNTDLPLIVIGTGVHKKDNKLLPAIAASFKGKNLLLGSVTRDNYKDIVSSAKEFGHNVIAEVPIDINLAKQLNILISEEGLPLDRIISYNISGALGYGFEYAYSTIEKIRLAALSGDKFLAIPQLAMVSTETWKAKEAVFENPEWGDRKKRYPLWESVGAIGYLMAGADIVVMHHPEAIRAVKKAIDKLVHST